VSGPSSNTEELAAKILDRVLAYAARGIRIFPCKRETKQPLVTDWRNTATTDPEIIRGWWGKWPFAMVGMPTGAANGVWVVDVDEGEGKSGEDSLTALVERNGPIPDTLIQITPRGGRHFFFKHPGGKVPNSASKIGKDLDVRGDGGYVIIPPSYRADGACYRWKEPQRKGLLAEDVVIAEAPDWLLQLAVAQKEKAKESAKEEPREKKQEERREQKQDRAKRRRKPSEKLRRYVEQALADEIEKVKRAPKGKRNDILNTAAFNLGQLVGAGVLDEERVFDALEEAAAGLADDDGAASVAKTIASGLAAGIADPRDMSDIKAASKRTQHTAPPELGGFDLNEDGIALAFVEKHKDALRYCHSTGKWFWWDGTRWLKEETKLAFCWARELCRELTAHVEEPDPKLAKATTAAAVERFAQADRAFAVTHETWDRDDFLLNTPTGTVDLRTGEVRPARQEDFCTKRTLVGPADGAGHPLWSWFLDEATCGDVGLQRFLQQMAGYALTGVTREHALFFVWGEGGNGKSVFLNTIAKILADYGVTAAMDTFTASRNDKHPTDLAKLRGAQLVSVSETEEGRAWAESRIKQMTGGDPISARFMRQDFFEYTPQFKLVVIGNHMPELHNVDEAMRRRFNIIPFTHKPPTPDKQLEDKLRAEYPAILRWMIDGCLDWQRNGLVRPEVVAEATEGYFEGQDLFRHWLDECCETGGGKSATTEQLYRSWVEWANGRGEKHGSQKSLTDKLKRRFKQTKHVPGTHNKRGFLGIDVKNEPPSF
jgi:P4 family phage/plasmid primase-like protien